MHISDQIKRHLQHDEILLMEFERLLNASETAAKIVRIASDLSIVKRSDGDPDFIRSLFTDLELFT